MSTINLNIPASLQSRIEEIARRENISIEQFIATALAEKVSALLTQEYLEQRAARGSRAKFEEAMKMIADVEPDEQDRF